MGQRTRGLHDLRTVGHGPRPFRRLGGPSIETSVGRRIKVLRNGCWQFGSSLDRYGSVNLTRRGGMTPSSTPAHRFVYETLIGPIDDDMHLHHECEHPGCVNPAHLLPLTPKEHAQRHAELRRATERSG